MLPPAANRAVHAVRCLQKTGVLAASMDFEVVPVKYIFEGTMIALRYD